MRVTHDWSEIVKTARNKCASDPNARLEYRKIFTELVVTDRAITWKSFQKWTDGFRDSWAFRGHADAAWDLETSLDRETILQYAYSWTVPGTVKAETVGVSDSQGHASGTFTAVTGYGAILGMSNSKEEQRVFLEPGHLELSDDDGFKAGLGVEKNLVTPRTGETHQTSAASLLLFDKNKNVIWKAP